MNNKVAIIIINWNNYKDTNECLNSLEDLSYTDFIVYLVDNASVDDSLNRLEDDYINNKYKLKITFIKTNINGGFAYGNNVGIKKAMEDNYKYFWLINNDTIIDKDSLSELMNALASDNKIGIVGSKILYYNTNKIWFAGGKVNTFSGNTKHLGLNESDNKDYDKLKQVDYVSGCSLLIKKEVIDEIGLMKEDYFLYYEETDWCIKAKKKKWNIMYQPKSIIYHKVSSSSGGQENISSYVPYYFIRNSYAFIKLNYHSINAVTCYIYNLFRALKQIIKIFVTNQNNKNVRIKYLTQAFKDIFNFKLGKHPDL